MKKSKILLIFFMFTMSVLIQAEPLEVRVGVYENPPKIFTNTAGEVSGFWAEIINYLAAKENWEIKWVYGNWQECLDNLETGKIDIMVDVAYTEERSERYIFQEESTLSSWTQLYKHKDVELNSILDLNEKRAGALRGSVNLEGTDGFRELIEKFKIDCTVIEYDSYEEVFSAIENREVDAGISNRNFGNRYEKEYQVERTPIIFQPIQLYFVFSPANALSYDLAKITDRYVRNLKSDQGSVYYRALEKHIGGVHELRIFPFWLKLLAIMIILAAIIFFIFILVLKYKVREKTRQLEENVIKLNEAQKEMKAVLTRWESTFNSIQDAIMLLNVENEILEINEAGIRLSGMAKPEIIGRKCHKLFHNSEALPDYCPCLRARETRNVEVSEVIWGDRNYQVTAYPIIDESGKLSGFSHAVVDITERIKAKKKLQDYQHSLEHQVQTRTEELELANRQLRTVNDKLEEASRLKSQFLANMSHELRSPLNSIIGFTGIMLQGISGDLNEEQEKQLKMVYESSKHLLGLINDILDLSKVEAGKIKLNIDNFETVPLIEMVRKMIAPMAEEKGLKFQVETGEDVPRQLYSDKNRIKQVLINLLSNAVKFTEKGGILISCRTGQSGKEVIFCVQDSGIGIKEENKRAIFDEFMQVERENYIKPEGTGLGLAISQKMVELMGGRIWLKSEYGKGSEFCFAIPVSIESAEPAATEEKKEIVIEGERRLILTIDDDRASQEILKTYLERSGYEVIRAYNGDDAIKYAEKYQPFAITLDIVLPGRDGWEILDHLKNNPATSDIPVICISILDNRQLGLTLGAVEYLVKPINSKELINELRRLERQFCLKEIIIIDDEQADRELLKNYLQEYGTYEIIQAEDGEQGLNLIRQELPDLIILDLLMPVKNGFEVIKELKLDSKTSDIPIIIVSSKVLDKDEVKYLNDNIEGIIRKAEFEKDHLAEDVLRMIRKIEAKITGENG